ncbi:hypothetical protein HUE87_01835 [Candidatus Sulfurimonas marisnigri]|uniref:Uncharacterized protein n=1 Tax=Candidatus Sulfurimonas marisnigri TaxID=2740405 RepID=A0A7S7M147_9BACT|nr:hypothetical protein [Candidatus Sulfurimonas marisnigri]QOY55010.1 hypothetical protein HUE87_01835 [Candidatus Sulfurimonas marisnigri]
MKNSNNKQMIFIPLLNIISIFLVMGSFFSELKADTFSDTALVIDTSAPVTQNGTVKGNDHDRYTITINEDGNFSISLTGDATVRFEASGTSMPDTQATDATMTNYNLIVSQNDIIYVSVQAPGQNSNQNYAITFALASVLPPVTALGVTGIEAEESILLRESFDIYGDTKVIGNGILWKNTTGSPTDRNNAYNMVFNDIDADATTFNSSSADLDLGNVGYEIVYSRLYWQGHICDDTGATVGGTCQNTNITGGALGTDDDKFNNAVSIAHTIKFKAPSGAYQSLSSSDLHYVPQDSNNRILYSASYDVTNIVKSGGEGTYTVANLVASEGQIDAWGAVGAWSLVTVYKDSSGQLALKNVSIFHGFQVVDNGEIVDVPITGFLTPRSGPVNSTASFFTVDGDKLGCCSTGELFQMQNANNSDTLENITDFLNPAGNQFNSTISHLGVDTLVRNPNHADNLGADIDTMDISSFLKNAQTSTSFRFSNNGDLYNLAFIVFSTTLYEPKFCYDYAYKQQNSYFTEDNNGTENPRISGTIISGEPIETTIFIRNLVDSDIIVSDMFVDIADINTSQANYISNSTKLAKIGDITPNNLADGTDVTIGNDLGGDNIKNIDIGSINSNEHFYIYYSIDPTTSTIDIPINVQARYNITVAGVTTPYTLQLGSQMSMCSESNFNYEPTSGRFNVVHNDYYDYDAGGTNRYYNLPTQVTSRAGNFKVLSMNKNNFDELNATSTLVAVELIDAGVFHDTYASCEEIESSISEKIWVFLNDSTSTMFDSAALEAAIGLNNTITSSAEFYQNSRQNAAFRLSFPVSNDGNDSLVQLSWPPNAQNEQKIENFSEIVQVVGACSKPVVYPLNATQTSIATQAAQACGNSGNFISQKHIQACMECIYGTNTRFICSRDNFALRPEAFMIKIDDQNQTNPASQLRIADDVSGVVTPSTVQTELAAGYDYSLKINATNHLNNNSSSGYTKTFDSAFTDSVKYAWSPSGAPTGCNDDSNVSIPMRFVNGSVDINSSLNQVGEYGLNITDTTWTTVDNTQPAHHAGTYFLGGADCVVNSSATKSVAASSTALTPQNGCNISSNHDSSGSTLKYRDYNLEFHPYKFDMSGVTQSHGENNNTLFNANTFIYMSDMTGLDNDEEMSFHLNGTITARGENNIGLSNFVNNCYAQPIDLNISKSAISGAVDYKYIYHNSDLPANDQNGTMNNIIGTISILASDFNQSNNGSVNTNLNLNFDRTRDTVMNPEELTFSSYNADCTTPANCTMNADLTATKTTQGVKDLNQTIKHYYGRSHASRQRYEGDSGTANIYYEVYCFDTIGINTCDKALLQQGFNSSRTDDLRWYINEEHNTTNNGNIGTVQQNDATPLNAADDIVDVTAQNDVFPPPATATLEYDETKGYPYKTTMHNNPSGWLIYNKDDPTATRNQFSVEFEKIGGEWSGAHDTDTVTKDTNATRTNRRIMW